VVAVKLTYCTETSERSRELLSSRRYSSAKSRGWRQMTAKWRSKVSWDGATNYEEERSTKDIVRKKASPRTSESLFLLGMNYAQAI
jgi:hypothetical protein